jgi:hypothetical protein
MPATTGPARRSAGLQAPYTVTGAAAAPWAFAGNGFGDGSVFGTYGIEIDAHAPTSPPVIVVLAQAQGAVSPTRAGEMTYYETPAGAKVFAAGTLNFAASIDDPAVGRLIDNVWSRLASP